MPPGLASGSSTPLPPTVRESFGAPLPGKRQRKSEKAEKPLDLVSSLEQQDKDTKTAIRRSSRRVSSMLARADLSASHERTSFAEQPHVAVHTTARRNDSLGSFGLRQSTGYNAHIHPSLSSLLEAPFDVGLDEGFHKMGLDDHDFEGLQQEIQLSKIHTVSLDSSNVRYSMTEQPAKNQSKVFILTAPPFATNERSRSELLVCIQDPLDKRLQLITLYLKLQPSFDAAPKAGRKEPSNEPAKVIVTPGELRKAQNVVDSCKITDGDQSVILILSESMDGKHELSTQAPWSELTRISLSLLFVDNIRSLLFRGRKIDRDVKERKSEVIDVSNGSIVGIQYPRSRGMVDVVDTEGRRHQLRIQLEPSCPQVRKVLASCGSILPDCLGERMHAGWFHVMQWLDGREETASNREWSAVTILLLVIFLNLGRAETQMIQTTRLPLRKKRPASGSFGSIRESDDWKNLELGETSNSLGCPSWMLNKGWVWALDEDIDDALSPHGDQSYALKFISRHIVLAKEYMTSALGIAATGSSGYLPTALSRSLETRRKAAEDIFLGLHLLLEEQKLDIMTPEYTTPGRADLRVVLCQVARWLRWHSFWSVYELGIQEDIDHRHDSGKCVTRYDLAKLIVPRTQP
jgi:anaphase-promoting complex subunit 1